MKKALSIILFLGMATTPMLSSNCFADEVTAKANSQVSATQTVKDKQQVIEPVLEANDIQEKTYFKEAMAEIEKIKLEYDNATFNITKYNILQDKIKKFSAEYKAFNELLKSNKDKSLSSKVQSIKLKLDFLNNLSESTMSKTDHACFIALLFISGLAIALPLLDYIV